MNNDAGFELRLLQYFRELTELYKQALPLARTLSEGFDLSESSQLQLAELDGIIARARALENESMELRRSVSAERISENIELSLASRNLEEVLRELIERCDQTEQRANLCKQNLQPLMQQQLQTKRAITAYTK